MKATLAAAALAVTCAVASPASALTAAFTPVTGDAFQSVIGSGDNGRRDGFVENNSTTFPATVGASLGGAAGGQHGFTVIGTGNGLPVTCRIIPESPQSDGVFPQVFSQTVTTNGTFSMFIDTNVPGSFVFYNVECVLPVWNFIPARIRGVIPQHAQQQLLLPASAAGFGTSVNSAVLQASYTGWAVHNSSQTDSLTLEAPIGRWNGQAKMQIFGQGNGGLTICDVLVTTEAGGGVANVFRGSKMVTGPFQLDILTGFIAEPAYYSVRCTLPPRGSGTAASLYGVAPDR